MPVIRLTHNSVAKLKAPADRQITFWDTELRGFGCLVSGKTNTKSWIVQRGKLRRKIERVDLMGLAEARDVAMDWLRLMGKKIDPKRHAAEQETKSKAQLLTFRQALADHLATRKGGSLRAPTKRLYNNMADLHLKDWLDRPICEITGADALERFKEIRERSQKKKGQGLAANAALRMACSVYQSSIRRYPALGPANPLAVALEGSWLKQRIRDRHVSAEELPAFKVALDKLGNNLHQSMIVLLLFTGCRWREIAALQWDEVDLKAGTISLAAERTKSRRAFIVPLSEVPLDSLRKLHKIGVDSTGYVFPGQSKAGNVENISKSLNHIGKALGKKLSPHDLRRSYATAAHAAGVDMLLLKRLLNHSTQGDVTLGYIRTKLDQLQKAQALVGAYLVSAWQPRRRALRRVA